MKHHSKLNDDINDENENNDNINENENENEKLIKNEFKVDERNQNVKLAHPITTSQDKDTPNNNNNDKGKDSVYSLMVNTNGIGVLVLVCYMFSTGALFNILVTSFQSPLLLAYFCVVGFGLSSAVLAYTSLVKSSGPVVAVGVATIRKVVTVLLSYFVFPKPLTIMHVLSALFVFGGMALSSRPRQR
eukprot:CAMPEP_0114337978 /NCGR_PEP_ID=MMETSP0101-20121206/6735_1 /TAXON_ID=38822 ORGANISM="Pteridomonas danica, Strain PT" /NCGR_SAMPLE_ID=MMETSP0101 /ASSEMBLY_ACC=CAM_ASM_000211 /LENGTH=187 /DNA_ID=CAMNT_0001470417 /DNA_START=378 /DNA_END=941 /DNA_ORIENTATION=-